MDPVNFQARDANAVAEDVGYAIQVATSYSNQIEGVGLKVDGANILELGPGINFGPALILASSGAKVALADRFLAPWQETYHPAFYTALLDAWHGPDGAIRRTIEDCSYENTLRLIYQPAEALGDIADREFDIVMSNAVLEHVYDFSAVTKELSRITRLGGLNFHQVDYRDHRSFDRPLEFLLESTADFSQEFARISGERGNRVRPSEAEAMFEAAGFLIRTHFINKIVDDEYFRDFLPRLQRSNSCFKNWLHDDLKKISGLLICVLDDSLSIRASGELKLRHLAKLRLEG